MGLVGLLIAAAVVISIFVFFYFSNFSSPITPQDPKKISTEAQDTVNLQTEKSKLEQEQIKNIDLP